MTTAFVYDIESDFSNGVLPTLLNTEIRSSSITSALDTITVVGGTCTVLFKVDISLSDEVVLAAVVSAHDPSGASYEENPVNELGVPLVEIVPRIGKAVEGFSINFCDKTTWYPESKRVEGEIATTTGNASVFTLAHDNIIDVTHGKIALEHRIASYKPNVYVSGVLQTEREFAYDPGVVSADGRVMESGDYEIDYKTGTITFYSPPGVVPTVDYYYAYSSGYYVTPPPGKKLDQLALEGQFHGEIEMRDEVRYMPQVKAFALAAAGHLPAELLTSNGGPIEDESYQDLADPNRLTIYKTLDDFVKQAQKSFPVIPKIGDPGDSGHPRAMKGEQYIFRWPYAEAAAIELKSSDHVRVRIYLKYDQEFGGEAASITLYSLELDE